MLSSQLKMRICSIVKGVNLRILFQKLKIRAQAQSHKLSINAPSGSVGAINPIESLEILQDSADGDFDTALLEAAARTTSPNYSPLGEVHEFKSPSSNYFLSQTREYIVYTPAGYQQDEALPLVMVLHGCKQTHKTIRADSGFDEIADRERFIVVYPFVTKYVGFRNLNCWGWWIYHHVRSGTGEVEDLRGIIDQVQRKFSIDQRRIHITGLSSGAGMSVAAMVAHGSLFASGASVAGVPYGESMRAVRVNQFLQVKYHSIRTIVRDMKAQLKGKGRLGPLLIVQSNNDQTVEPKSALNLRDSWLQVQSVNTESPVPLTSSTRTTEWNYHRFSCRNEDTSVETLLVERLKHGWIGGNPGKYSDSRGPNISEMIWLFFKRHPR